MEAVASDRIDGPPALPLSRFRVLDLTRARSGPAAVRQFADWGADVIMIESPAGGGDILGSRNSSDFQNLHRNKRSLTLDLKDEADRETFYQLVRQSDVVVENFRPDVKHRLKIDYETLRTINPRVVYASLSGFGETGPYRNRQGLDQIIQGMGGLMAITGDENSAPMRAGIAVSDMAAGLYVAIAILTALLEREATGEGRWVRGSLLQSMIGMLDFQAVRWLVDGKVPQPEGNHHPSTAPMGLFETADGHVNMAASGDTMFARFCALTARPDLLGDERFATDAARYTNREQLRAEVNEIMRARPSAEWIDACNAAGLPCGPVYGVDQMFADQQVRHLHVTRTVTAPDLGELELLSQPIEFDGVDFQIRRPAPHLGEHSKEILEELEAACAPSQSHEREQK